MGLNPRFPQRGSGYFGLDEQPPWSQVRTTWRLLAQSVNGVEAGVQLWGPKTAGWIVGARAVINPRFPALTLRAVRQRGRLRC